MQIHKYEYTYLWSLIWAAQDFTEVGYDDFYLGCLLTNMNDPQTRQFQNPNLCFHDPNLPIQIRETLLYSMTIQTVITAETTPTSPLSLSQTTETTPLPSLSFSQEQHVHLVGGKRVLWEQRGIPCRGGTKSAMIFLSFIESFCFSWRWSRRMSISSSLGITSLTGTGLARGAFWSRCQDFWRNAKGQHFSTNISYSNHLVPGTIGSVWLILTRMEHGFGTTLESRLISSCKKLIRSLWTDFHLYCIHLIYSQLYLFPQQEQIPKVGERGLGRAWRAVRPSQLWCVQVKKSPTKILHMCVDQNSMETETLFHKHRQSSGSGSRKAVTRMVRD